MLTFAFMRFTRRKTYDQAVASVVFLPQRGHRSRAAAHGTGNRGECRGATQVKANGGAGTVALLGPMVKRIS